MKREREGDRHRREREREMTPLSMTCVLDGKQNSKTAM